MKQYTEYDMIMFACEYAQEVLKKFRDKRAPDPMIAFKKWKDDFDSKP